MSLFMLDIHDRTQNAVRILLEDEIDRVFGADGVNGSIDDDDPPCETTMCDCTVITPGSDGEPQMDCDGG